MEKTTQSTPSQAQASQIEGKHKHGTYAPGAKPSSSYLSGLAAFINSSPRVQAQNQFAAQLQASPVSQAQSEMAQWMNFGPESATAPGALSMELPSAASGSSIEIPVVQRLVGAGAQPGHSQALPGTAATLGEAAAKAAKYINLRTRTTGAGRVEASSALGANNPGNLHIQSNFDDGAGAASLEVWVELTGVGGGYVKRVRVTNPGGGNMDRVMNEPAGTALQVALAADRHGGPGALAGAERYGSVHGVHGGDAAALNIGGDSDRSADNVTKMVGEGARFGWLATGLGAGQIGNTSRGVLNFEVKVAQMGTFTINPTFQQLWGAWASAFDRSYMKDLKTAKAILKAKLLAGWKPPAAGDAAGVAPLASGTAAAGQVTSLSRRDGAMAMVPAAGHNGAAIVSDLGITWTSER